MVEIPCGVAISESQKEEECVSQDVSLYPWIVHMPEKRKNTSLQFFECS